MVNVLTRRDIDGLFFFFFFRFSIERDVEMNKDCCKSCKNLMIFLVELERSCSMSMFWRIFGVKLLKLLF